MQMDRATGISKLSAAKAGQDQPTPSALPAEENLQSTAAEEPPDESD